MERINLKCRIAGQEVELQLDKKSMPGEAGLCFMITEGGCFKGYISQQKNRTYQHLGVSYYTDQELQIIVMQLNMKV